MRAWWRFWRFARGPYQPRGGRTRTWRRSYGCLSSMRTT